MPRLIYNVSMFWRYERAYLRGAAVNIFASEVDAETHRRAFPGRRVAVVPNGVDSDYFAPMDLPPDPATVLSNLICAECRCVPPRERHHAATGGARPGSQGAGPGTGGEGALGPIVLR
jgi:glycosyltransferase involved in cell wall biosynthesis